MRRFLLLGLAALWIGGSLLYLRVVAYREQRDRLMVTYDEQNEIRDKLRRLAAIQDAPRIASIEIESPAETTQRIVVALKAAGLPDSALLRLEPSPPVRMDQSDFEIRRTQIELTPATLVELGRFANELRRFCRSREPLRAYPRDRRNIQQFRR